MLKALIIQLAPIESVTSAVYRTLAMAKGLKAHGYNVTFLTTPMNQNLVMDQNKELLSDFHIITTGSVSAYNAINASTKTNGVKRVIINAIRTVARKIWHVFSLFDYTILLTKKVTPSELDSEYYDLILSSSDPKTSHIAARTLIIKGLSYGKWVQYWGDPMTLDISNKSIYPSFILKAVERSILKDADQIVYVSPMTLDEQKKLFPKFTDKFDWLPIPYIEEKKSTELAHAKFTVSYIGSYTSRVRNIIPFYQAARKLQSNVETFIVGDSDTILEATDWVHIIPRSVGVQYEKIADLLVCIMNRSGTQIPGKVYHVAATDKPILIILDGENTDSIRLYLEKYDRFLFSENQEESILTTIHQFQQAPRTFKPVPDFRCDVVAEQLLNILEKNRSNTP